jgi:glycosyltransferase involved in cell wall biosynthesis
MHAAFPDARLYTSLYEPDSTFAEFAAVDIETSLLDRSSLLRRSHRLALPLLPLTFSSMEVDAQVVVCSSSGWAHGVRATGRKLVYCYAPARWLYQTKEYLATSPRAARATFACALPLLARWDRRAARSADRYIAISTRTRDLIRAAYGIDAEVLAPPCTLDASGPRRAVADVDGGFFLCVSRLIAYKNVAAVVEAFRMRSSERLVVVGRGPEERRLREALPDNVRLLATVEDDELRWLYANARAVVAASYEDFGLTPLEAGVFGIPTVALRFGGYRDTVVEGMTGLFFDAPDPGAIAEAVDRLHAADFDPTSIREHARSFREERFHARLHEIVESLQ